MSAQPAYRDMTPAQKMEAAERAIASLPEKGEPAFDMSDAAANVASSRDDLPVLVQDVAEAEGLLDWIAFNVEIPERHRQSFRLLGRHAHELNVALGKEYDVLNGRAE